MTVGIVVGLLLCLGTIFSALMFAKREHHETYIHKVWIAVCLASHIMSITAFANITGAKYLEQKADLGSVLTLSLMTFGYFFALRNILYGLHLYAKRKQMEKSFNKACDKQHLVLAESVLGTFEDEESIIAAKAIINLFREELIDSEEMLVRLHRLHRQRRPL